MTSSRGVGPTVWLGVGAVANGALAYAFFAVSTRALGVADTGPVSVLWAYWGIAGAALTFPLQHWIVRLLVVDGEGYVASSLRRLSVAAVALSLLAAIVCIPLRDVLFFDSTLVFPLLVGLVTLGSALTGVARGGLAARGRIRALAGMLVLENASRVAGAVLLVALGVDDPVLFGVALVAGHLVALAFPSALRFGPAASPDTPASLGGLGAASAGQLLAQIALTGPPIVLAAIGGSASETALLFAVLALYRAPYTVALGVVPQLTRWWSRRVAAGGRTRDYRPVVGVGAATGAGVLAAVAVGSSIGPSLVAVVFGDGFDVSARVSVLVAVGSAVAVGNLAATVALISAGSSSAISRSWVAAVVMAAVVAAAVPAPSIDRVAVGFASAQIAAFVLLLARVVRDESRRHPEAAGTEEGGSPEDAR